MLNGRAILSILFITYSLYLSFLDLKQGSIPRFLQLSGSLLFLFYQYFLSRQTFLQSSLIGAAVGIIIFALVALIVRKKIGLADIWYAGTIGVVLGPVRWYGAIFCACGLAVGAFLFTRRKRLPFIPFMAAGAIPWLFVSDIHL